MGDLWTNLRRDIRSQEGRRESAAWDQAPRVAAQASEAARRGLWPVIPAPARPGSGRSSPRRRSRRCPRCGTRFQEWKSACSLRQGPGGLRTDRAAAALHACLRRSASLRCLTRHFGGGGRGGGLGSGMGRVVGRPLWAQLPRHAGNCSLKCKSPLPRLGAKAEKALLGSRSSGRSPSARRRL